MTTSEKMILLVDADGDCEQLASAAAARNGWEVKRVKTSREAFALLQHRLSNFAVVLVDVDPGAHGLALLEAISGCGERPPMIVLTALEESYMNAIACEHGAALCLSKPISSSRLSAALHNLSCDRISTCDHWGHLLPTPIDNGSRVKTAVRGIAAKLSAGALETESKRKRNKPEPRRTALRV
jgi:DNA-binding response OmpR family regulator